MTPRSHARGQTLVALAIVLAPLTALALAVAGTGQLVIDQTRLQAAVDAAAYSAAALEAETLNRVAVTNRVHAAHLVTAAQATSLVSHYRALDRAAHAAAAAGATSVLGPALAAIGRATGAAGAAATALARGVVPLARLQDAALAASARAAVARSDAGLGARVERVLREAAPGARLTPAAAATLRSAPLARALTSGDEASLVRVAVGSRDRFTAGERGRPPLGRTWQIARVGKRGTTTLGAGASLEAVDTVGLDLGKRGRVGIRQDARGSEFGWGRLPALLALRDGPPPPVRVEATLGSWGGRRLSARAAAAAVYRRPGRPGERPSLFGPFWRPRLVPFGGRPPGSERGPGGSR